MSAARPLCTDCAKVTRLCNFYLAANGLLKRFCDYQKVTYWDKALSGSFGFLQRKLAGVGSELEHASSFAST